MKYLFFTFFMLFLIIWNVNASSWNIDYVNDYTLIDCVNWSDSSWVAFDNDKPYETLKKWIESTIEYINSEIDESNTDFNIKVNCSFSNLLDKTIYLDFNWIDNQNKLIIEGINNDSLVLKNTKFIIKKWAWNIVIKNATFLNNDMWYFEDQVFNATWWRKDPISNWITIYDSYFKLNNSFNLWIEKKYYYAYSRWIWWRNNNQVINYTNKIKIINSQIDVELDWNYNFKMPFYLKDSEIKFKNNTSTGVYEINFTENWNISNLPRVDYSVFISNEIDLWWNNLKIENTENISFLNNKILNISSIDLWIWAIFINNFIENKSKINISNYKNLFNNIFNYWFEDSYDIENYRRNFSLNNIWKWWLWWIYKRIRDFSFWSIDINSASIYQEVTWKKLEKWLWEIYVIFNY